MKNQEADSAIYIAERKVGGVQLKARAKIVDGEFTVLKGSNACGEWHGRRTGAARHFRKE